VSLSPTLRTRLDGNDRSHTTGKVTSIELVISQGVLSLLLLHSFHCIFFAYSSLNLERDRSYLPNITASIMSSTPSSKLNIAIIGGGLIGPRHAKSILSNPNTTLIALVDPAPYGPSLASSLKTNYYASLSSLLSSPHRPDAVIICTPNHTHVPLSLELISAGIPVLVEKPISTSIESGLRLISAAKKDNVKVLVGHHRRFNPYLLAAKKVLDEGSLGRVVAVQGIWCLKKPGEYYDGIGEWRRGESGSVVLLNLIHEVDLLQCLLGPIVLVSAFETVKTRGFEAEEGAAILLRFQSGVVGTFILSDSVPSPWNFESGTGENPTIPYVKKEEGAGGFYRIMGTEGSLSVPDLKRWSNESWNDVLKTEDLAVDREKIPFDLQVQHFYEVVREGKEPSCTGEQGLSAMVVCEAVKRSMASGEAMEIDGFEIKPRGSSRTSVSV
jgi:predicted dehydrogenase